MAGQAAVDARNAFPTLLREVGEQILCNIIEKLDKFVFPTLRREVGD